MTTLLDPDVKRAIEIAQALSKEYHQSVFSAAHLLKAILHNEFGLAATLATWGKDIHYMREWADLRIEQTPKSGQIHDSPRGDKTVEKVIEVADMQRLKLGKDAIGVDALFASICKTDVAYSQEQLKSFPITETEYLSGIINEIGVIQAISSAQENGAASPWGGSSPAAPGSRARTAAP